MIVPIIFLVSFALISFGVLWGVIELLWNAFPVQVYLPIMLGTLGVLAIHLWKDISTTREVDSDEERSNVVTDVPQL